MEVITAEEFVNFFKYFENKPHQVAAVKDLYRYLDLNSKSPEISWIKMYRNAPAKGSVHITKQQLAAVWQCSESYKFDVKNQCCIWWYHPAGTRRAITKLWRDCQHALFTNLHAGNALFPSWNDLSTAKGKAKRRAAFLGIIKNGAIGQASLIMH